MKTFLFLVLFFTHVSFAQTQPAWQISCQGNEIKELRVDLYQTGHPQGGTFSFSGVLFFNGKVVFTHFKQANPPVLFGVGDDLSQTEYSLAIPFGLLNDPKGRYRTNLDYKSVDPLGNHGELTSLAIECTGR